MWNEVFREHQNLSPHCKGNLEWDLSKEKKWGSAWRECAKCTQCAYKSKMFNLYEEVASVKRGRRAAKINLGLQVGLHHTPISTASYRKICMASNIPPPSVSGMQHTANAISEKIEEENMRDLQRQREKIKRIKKIRGENSDVVNIQSDCVYNNAIYSGIGKTPFQPATQCVYTVAENETYKHSIINTLPKSKLCSKRKHTVSTNVGEHAGPCTANINMQDSIGNEERWARECFEELKEDGLEINEVTTDPDSSAYRAAECLYQEGLTSTTPIHFLDTRHVASNHRKFVNNLSTVCDIMPARLKVQRTRLQSLFASDMAARCQAEFVQANIRYHKSPDVMKSKLSYVSDAIVGCYCGDHTDCSLYSFVCSKSRKSQSWIDKSAYLKRHNFEIELNENSENILRQCVNYRLGPGMLAKTAKSANTQKVEALNRSIRSTVPVNVTYARNFTGRVHTACHKVNHGTGNSIVILCEAAGSPIQPGTKVAKSLKKLEDHSDQMRNCKYSENSINHRNARKHALYDIHARHQEEKDYTKNKLLPVTKNSPMYPKDHSYGRLRKSTRLSNK